MKDLERTAIEGVCIRYPIAKRDIQVTGATPQVALGECAGISTSAACPGESKPTIAIQLHWNALAAGVSAEYSLSESTSFSSFGASPSSSIPTSHDSSLRL